MVELSHKQKRLIKIVMILVLLLATVMLALISRNKPQQDSGQKTPSSTAITPVSGRFPTLPPPAIDTEGNPPANTILIKDFSYRPNILRVKVGTPIDIFNADSAGHSVSSDEVMFDTGILGQNERGTLTFDTPGTYSYHCRRHPAMVATIVVTP